MVNYLKLELKLGQKYYLMQLSFVFKFVICFAAIFNSFGQKPDNNAILINSYYFCREFACNSYISYFSISRFGNNK